MRCLIGPLPSFRLICASPRWSGTTHGGASRPHSRPVASRTPKQETYKRGIQLTNKRISSLHFPCVCRRPRVWPVRRYASTFDDGNERCSLWRAWEWHNDVMYLEIVRRDDDVKTQHMYTGKARRHVPRRRHAKYIMVVINEDTKT